MDTSPRHVEDLLIRIAERGGVVHSSDLRAAGVPMRTMRTAVAADLAVRVRRSWLALRDCAPERVAAASVGGRLTCVSAAAGLGLWAPTSDGDVHVAVSSNASRIAREGIRLHWSSGPAPIARNRIDDAILNVLFHTARCLPRADALAVWESALRTRQVDSATLGRVAWRSSRASEIAEFASDLSDSGLETRFLVLMREIGVAVRQQVLLDGHRVDNLIGTSLVAQLDGFAHHRDASDRRRDIRADARLALRGFTVLRFDYQQVYFDVNHVQDTIAMAIAQGLHLRH